MLLDQSVTRSLCVFGLFYYLAYKSSTKIYLKFFEHCMYQLKTRVLQTQNLVKLVKLKIYISITNVS